MKGRLFRLFALTIAIVMIAGPVSAQSNPDKPYGQSPTEAQVADQVPNYSLSGPAVYIVRLEDAPLASYRGGVAGLQATTPGAVGEAKLDVNSPASVAYRDYLAEKQDRLITAMQESFGHEIEVLYRYDVVYNGLAVRLTGQEALELAAFPGVAGVQPEFVRYPTTDVGPEWIGAPGIWDGTDTGGLPGTMGEGIIVGVIDTGINFDHPSFADVGDDGYNHTNPLGAGVYKGWCNPANPDHDPAVHKCNDKLIGAWDYTGTPEKGEDDDGHGSHTTSTAAGNVLYDVGFPDLPIVFARISGVAPHANVIMYDACIADAGCPGAGLLEAINQAVTDGVDVINYSIGGGPNDPWSAADSDAFLNARAAGVFVATSAGNDGPGAGTIGSPANAPWLLSVGAETHNRTFVNDLAGMSGGGAPPPPDLHGTGVSQAYGPAPIVHAGAVGDPLCGTAFPAGTWTSGEIVVCDRGEYALVDKAANVRAGGAGGVVIANQDFNGSQTYATNFHFPGTHLTYLDSELLRAWLGSGSGHMARITASVKVVDPSYGDNMALFSSRGPNPPVPGIIKPDVIAPGQDIFAAYMNGIEYAMIGGTSMSSPHAAGAAALLKALHPTWTNAEVQSALMTTAFGAGVRKEGGTPADPFDMGAGRVDLSRAGKAGLVLDETIANFENADPALAGDPRQLNLASLADADCQGTCSWTRTVKSTLGAPADWTATVVGAPPGLAVTVTPGNFTVAAGGTQALNIEADVTGFNATLHGQDGWGFAWLQLASAGQETLHLPIAVRKNYTSAPLFLSKATSVLEAKPGQTVEYTIELTNRDNVPNTYDLVDSLPPGVEYMPGTATGGLVYNPATRQLTWSGQVDAGAIEYTITPVDHIPYVNLANLGAAGICANYFTTGPNFCDDVTLIWSLGGDSYTYFGETLGEVWQSSNSMIYGPEGWLGSACSACNQPLPWPEEVNQVVAGLWRDARPGTNPGARGEFYGAKLTGLLPNPNDLVFYGNWHNVGQYGFPFITSRHAIAIVLDGQSEPAGRIYYIYDDITGNLATNGYTVGIEDKYGEKGTTWAYAPCDGGACIAAPPPPVGSQPPNGTTLRLDPVITGVDYHKVFSFKVRVTTEQGGVLTNRVEVTSNSPDPRAQSMWAIADTLIAPLYIAKEVTPVFQDPGGVMTYTITFGNRGAAALTGVVISDTLPAGVEYDSSDPPGTYNPATHELVWAGLTLNPGDHVTATVVVTLSAGVTPGIRLRNMVYFFHGGMEPLVAGVSHYTSSTHYPVYLPLVYR